MALVPCPGCGTEISTEAPACPRCGRPQPGAGGDATLLQPPPAPPPPHPAPPQAAPVRVDRRQLLGGGGAALLLVGVFAPVVRAPLVGGVSLLDYQVWAGFLVLTLAVVAAVFVLAGRFDLLPFAGGAALLAALGTLGFLLWRIADTRRELRGEDAEMAQLGEAMLHLIKIDWGWLPLIAGAVLVIAAGRARPGAVELSL